MGPGEAGKFENYSTGNGLSAFSSGGYGIAATSNSSAGGAAIFANTNAALNQDVVFIKNLGAGYGLIAIAEGGNAISGRSINHIGVLGQSQSSDGINGYSESGSGIFGNSITGRSMYISKFFGQTGTAAEINNHDSNQYFVNFSSSNLAVG
jgi:hypothetical protein